MKCLAFTCWVFDEINYLDAASWNSLLVAYNERRQDLEEAEREEDEPGNQEMCLDSEIVVASRVLEARDEPGAWCEAACGAAEGGRERTSREGDTLVLGERG
jgi:hypothetical protein